MSYRLSLINKALTSAVVVTSVTSCQFSVKKETSPKSTEVATPSTTNGEKVEMCRIEIDTDILDVNGSSLLLNKATTDLDVSARAPAGSNELYEAEAILTDTNKDGLVNQGEVLAIKVGPLSLETLFAGGKPKIELGQIFKRETSASGLPVKSVTSWAQGSCSRGETVKLSSLTTVGDIKLGAAKSGGGVDSQAVADPSAVCNVLIDTPLRFSQFVPQSDVKLMNFGFNVGTTGGSFRTIGNEIKNKTDDQLIAVGDIVMGRFTPDVPESLSPLVDGKRKIGVDLYNPNDQSNFFQHLGYLECAPGGSIKLSELKPYNTTNKVCTVEVDTIPAGVTSWDDAINVNNITFGLNFSVKVKQVSPNSQVTVGDKVDVYLNDSSAEQPVNNKYTMSIGHVSGECEVGGAVRLSTFH